MALSSEMHDHIGAGNYVIHEPFITNVTVHEMMTRVGIELIDSPLNAGVRQCIEVCDLRVRLVIEKVPDEVGADESGSTSDEIAARHTSEG